MVEVVLNVKESVPENILAILWVDKIITIDHFHNNNHHCICYSFVFLLIKPTGLTLV